MYYYFFVTRTVISGFLCFKKYNLQAEYYEGYLDFYFH